MLGVRPFAVLLAVGALLTLAPTAAAAPRKVPRGFHAVMFDGAVAQAPAAVQERQFALMARSGVESIRYVFLWAFMQPDRGGRFDFDQTDQVVGLAAEHGITVLPVMIEPPAWGRAFPKRDHSPPLTRPYQEFLRASIERYGSRGSFWRQNPDQARLPIRDWQIWNEPNIDDLWDPPEGSRYSWPRGYARLLRASKSTIERTDPRAETVIGALVGLSWVELRRLFKAGARRAFDTVAVNVYTQSETRVLAIVRRVREELDRAGLDRARIEITETSFPASRGKVEPLAFQQRQETPRTMAKRLRRVYGLLARNRRRYGLDGVYWYTWASAYEHPTSNFAFAGLLASPDGRRYRRQPALAAFRDTAARWQGCRKTERGACRRRVSRR